MAGSNSGVYRHLLPPVPHLLRCGELLRLRRLRQQPPCQGTHTLTHSSKSCAFFCYEIMHIYVHRLAFLHFSLPPDLNARFFCLKYWTFLFKYNEGGKDFMYNKLKGLSHKHSGGFCYISIESYFQGLMLPSIKF